jgi:hypothetical protein
MTGWGRRRGWVLRSITRRLRCRSRLLRRWSRRHKPRLRARRRGSRWLRMSLRLLDRCMGRRPRRHKPRLGTRRRPWRRRMGGHCWLCGRIMRSTTRMLLRSRRCRLRVIGRHRRRRRRVKLRRRLRLRDRRPHLPEHPHAANNSIKHAGNDSLAGEFVLVNVIRQDQRLQNRFRHLSNFKRRLCYAVCHSWCHCRLARQCPSDSHSARLPPPRRLHDISSFSLSPCLLVLCCLNPEP